MSDIRRSPDLTINRVPYGLSGLTDTKAQGTGPWVLDGRVQAAINIGELYEQYRPFQGYGYTLSATAVGQYVDQGTAGSYNSSVVPAGELWRLVAGQVSSTSALAAGTTYTVGLGLQCKRAGLQTYLSLGDSTTATAGMMIQQGWTGSLWMSEGDSLCALVNQYVAGTAKSFRLYFYAYRYAL